MKITTHQVGLAFLSAIICGCSSQGLRDDYGTCVSQCAPHLTTIPGTQGPDGRKGDQGDCVVEYSGRAREPCQALTLSFKNQIQTTDFIRLKSPFPETTKLTFCAGVDFDEGGNIRGTVVSYATQTEYNAFVIFHRKVAFMTAEFTIPDGIGNINSHQDLCLVISVQKESRSMRIFVDGRFVGDNVLPMYKRTLPSGGYFIIGQKQSNVLGGFDSSQAYYGNITNMKIWDRILSDDEISNLFNICGCHTDAAVVPTATNIQLNGLATIENYNSCMDS